MVAVGSYEQGLHWPYDVLECASDDSFIVVNFKFGSNNLIKTSRRDGTILEVYGTKGDRRNGEFYGPTALAALPDGGLVVRERDGARFQVFDGPAC